MKEYIVHVPKHLETKQEKIVTFFGEPIIELIRCNDCKWYEVAELIRCNSCAHYNESPVMLGYCLKWGLYTEQDGFCYKAEQAENAQ